MPLEPSSHPPAQGDVILCDLTRDNCFAVCNLKPRPDQAHFVAPNAYSLVESMYWPDRHPYAIYAGETLVGFAMWAINPDIRNPAAGSFWVLCLMIDAQHQGRGYGRAATVDLLRRLRGAGV